MTGPSPRARSQDDAHLRDLRYFVAVAEELSFTAAARRLHVSQPALSKQIRALEAALGLVLFDRDRRQVRLTPAGVALVDEARSVGERWSAAVDRARAATAATVRLGAQTSIGRHLLPAATALFRETAPHARVELRSFGWHDPTVGLHDGSCDVAYVWLPLDDPEFEVRAMITEPRWVAMSAKHALAGKQRISFGDLLDEAFVALPAAAGPAREFWLACGDRGGAVAKIAAEASSSDEVFEAVAGGLGVVLLAAGNALLYQRPDVAFRPVDGIGPATLAVAWRRGDDRRAVREFVAASLAAASSPHCPPQPAPQ